MSEKIESHAQGTTEAGRVRQNLLFTAAMPILTGSLLIRWQVARDEIEILGFYGPSFIALVMASTAIGFVIAMRRFRHTTTGKFLLIGIGLSLLLMFGLGAIANALYIL